ncbi:HD-GYP domain-containing protein [Pseudomonas matsuisoli]|uniref:HD family phosphohydrolase n=1 Tax=Pseudomonas matsuisoli TaxID=1515666 RepID=A0A917UZK9_9PSED|nr:HD domain-containing phosphohydrolase [Pseudomonas matsuisoli]GGK01099.1 HD family phosphohydrolase [Pseudomonas matsuisoli]
MSDASYISPEQLCVGLYVQLDLKWWEHGFTFSNFKIKDASQVEALRKLGLQQVRYDPARSDAQPLPLAPAPVEPAPEQELPPSVPTAEELKRKARAVQLGAVRRRLAEVDKTFVQASQRVKGINTALRNQPDKVLAQAGEVITEMVQSVLGEDGAALHAINGKSAEDNYVHSLNVTVLSMMLGRQMGLDSEDCHTLGLGALLHDIGKLDIPSPILLKPGPLTKPEQKFLELHTEYGLRMGHKLMLDDEVLSIIHEHHEYCDGSGYPKGSHEANIRRLSRLVCITNRFDNLCNPSHGRPALNPHEALVRMFGPERARYDDVALRAFIRCMGVYPPGSLVCMEDGRHGLVLSMHPTLPLKPTVILYDAELPKSEALIVDLEQEPSLAIASSVAPKDVPIDELEYLDPRQQVSYYIDPRRRG